jgi:hypothetical protein
VGDLPPAPVHAVFRKGRPFSHAVDEIDVARRIA